MSDTQAEGVPKMTGFHVEVIDAHVATWAKNPRRGELPNQLVTDALSEILTVLASLASGSRDTYDTTSQVVVDRQKIEDEIAEIGYIATGGLSDAGWMLDDLCKRLSRWLSPRTDREVGE